MTRYIQQASTLLGGAMRETKIKHIFHILGCSLVIIILIVAGLWFYFPVKTALPESFDSAFIKLTVFGLENSKFTFDETEMQLNSDDPALEELYEILSKPAYFRGPSYLNAQSRYNTAFTIRIYSNKELCIFLTKGNNIYIGEQVLRANKHDTEDLMLSLQEFMVKYADRILDSQQTGQ